MEQEMVSTADDIVARTRRAQLALAGRTQWRLPAKKDPVRAESGGARSGKKRGSGGKGRKAGEERRAQIPRAQQKEREQSTHTGSETWRGEREADTSRRIRTGGKDRGARLQKGGAVPRARARRGAERTPDGEGRWLDPTIGDGSARGREDNGGFNSPPAEPQGRRGDGVETT